METRNLGKTGLKVSSLCLGTMTFGVQADHETSFAIMDKALDAGVTFIDTADGYPLGAVWSQTGKTEEIIGQWLQGKRSQVVLATKCHLQVGPGANDRGLSRKHIMDAVEGSLRRLKTDYIDLYQAHMFDPQTPVEETMRAFDDLVTQGKVRYIGVSNWRAWQIAKANGIADRRDLEPIVSVQPRYNLLFRMIEEELVPMADQEGIGIISYNPLAGGLLTGRYQWGDEAQSGTRFGLERAGSFYQERYWHEAQFNAVQAYGSWCKERELNMTTTAVRWVTQQPGITSAIIGASRPEQLDDSLHAAHAAPLAEDELAWLNGLWYSLPRKKEDR
ncbi:aldo/keto reductase [Paenibacillus beijingensis]|uniref:Alcohol dehydrogenase n=1 Tax=Paenibacillus beijingensis TaxID=1126833 RepID=A0A0D5NF98_9BACL|nr:aldo/keto reductase [Paenibacillus beijingensis]AJY73926.1 alcohol dehydrogenase [Paenibacillus beijingensis]